MTSQCHHREGWKEKHSELCESGDSGLVWEEPAGFLGSPRWVAGAELVVLF